MNRDYSLRSTRRTGWSPVRLLVAYSALCAVCFAATPVRNFNVPAGRAEDTLRTYAEQAGVELVFTLKQVGAARTNPIRGDLSPREALDTMLADTGLVAVQDEKTGALTVRRETEVEKNDASRPAGRATAEIQDGKVVLDEYHVTDRRVDGLINKGLLQAGADAPLYHSVINRADIERLGATSMEELFRYLPQTSTAVTPSQNVIGNFGSGARFQTTSLRGLPSSQTVILINGRALPRTTPTTGGGADVNRIPIAAIERIEILPYAGSAIYGAGAIGGAINVILRKDYAGRDLTTYVGTSTQGGATEYRFTYVEGRNFNDGKTNLTLTLNYQHRDELRADQRDYLDRLAAKFGPTSSARTTQGVLAFEQQVLPAFAGAPGTILVGNPLTAAVNDLGIPGAPGVRFAAIPTGLNLAQSQLLTPGSFTATAGQFNRGGRYSGMILYEPADSYNLNAQVEHIFARDRFEAYGEFTVGFNRRRIEYPEQLSFSLTATDPLNPFRTGVTPGFVGRPITVFIDTPDLPLSWSRQRYETARAVLGFKGHVSEKWEWSVDGTIDYSNSKSDSNSRTSYLTQLTALTRPAAAAPVATRRAIYPIFADHSQFPISAADAERYFWFTFHAGNKSVVTEGNARLTGEVWELPAGSLQTSVYGKYRTFDLKGSRVLDGSPDSAMLVNGALQATNNLPIVSQRATWQTAVEAAVPVIGRDFRPLPVQSLDLNLSASYEANDTEGHNQSSQRDFEAASKSSRVYVAAGKLQLTPDIALRGSFTEGFYPPDWNDVGDLVTPQVLASGLVPDPKRGNTIQTEGWTLMNGGNPNVGPESATSVNYGVLFTPRFIPGLSLTLDFWNTEKTDAIVRTNFVQVITNANDFAPFITRAPASPADTAAGWLGPITEVRTGPVNISTLETDGIDARGRYSLKTQGAGEFIFDTNLSFTNHFRTQALSTSAVIETAGAGGPIRWRGYGSVTWLKNEFGVTLTGRYLGHYASSTTAPTPNFPTALNLDGGRIPAYLHYDVQFTYEVPYRLGETGWRSWIGGTRWTLGALNVLDEEPTLVSDQSGYYNRQVDPRQRFVYLQVRKSL